MDLIKKITRWVLGAVLLFLLYVVICLVHGTLTDYQPEAVIPLETVQSTTQPTINTSRLSFLNWNIGYGGLGAKSNFFYDATGSFFFSGDKMVRSTEEIVQENIAGIRQFIEKHPADFIMLQEVDRNSKRSYYIDQHEHYLEKLPNYSHSFALNYKVGRVVIPVCEPWDVMGKMESGLSSFSKYQATKSTRYQYPGAYGWPDYIFHLDRCMLVQRYATHHPDGKELIVVNTHNSAYDGGVLKEQEMQLIKTFITTEYEKGNYVVVGGDWNQTPPNTPTDIANKAIGVPENYRSLPPNIPNTFMPEDWQWVFDPKVPTNRDMTNLLDYGKTSVSLIDYYLVSPNITVLSVKGENLKFANSDHNPILMDIELQGFESTTDTMNLEVF